MNTYIVLSFFALAVSITTAAPPHVMKADIQKLPALTHEEIRDVFGQYSLRYITAEGTIVSETGRLVPNPDGIGRVMVVNGEVTYIGDDGNTYKNVYNAGFNGYKVISENVPVVAPATSVV